MAVWFQRRSTAVLCGEGGWVAGRRWEFLRGFFFNLVSGDWSKMQWKTGQQAGAGQCATWGWVMGEYWRSMDLGHLLATWGWGMIACLICGKGAGSAPEDCGMVCLQGVDPDRPKVNQAPRRLKTKERVSDFFFVKSLKNPWMML